MAALSAWFWLPHNVTWADLADPAPGVEYPKAGHLLTALPLALGMFFIRILFERFIASTCAQSLHIQPGVGRRAQPNAVLEKVFTSITKVSATDNREIKADITLQELSEALQGMKSVKSPGLDGLVPKVSKDVRSDVESSSDEEPDPPLEDVKASYSPKGENGTNGHYTAAKARTHNHSSW